jgi:hypothetical protein
VVTPTTLLIRFRSESRWSGSSASRRTGGRPSPDETASVVARHQQEDDRIERYYDRAAKQTARIRYFGGMLLGLIPVALIAPAAAGIIGLFGDLDLSDEATRNFYACFGAGAVGAMVSVMTRMRQEDGVKLDYEVGSALTVTLGAFRPVLGAIFGTATFFALESGLIQPTPSADTMAFFYYPLFAFAAGFSERYAHVILGDADLSVARALTGGCPRTEGLRRSGTRDGALEWHGPGAEVDADHDGGPRLRPRSVRISLRRRSAAPPSGARLRRSWSKGSVRPAPEGSSRRRRRNRGGRRPARTA